MKAFLKYETAQEKSFWNVGGSMQVPHAWR